MTSLAKIDPLLYGYFFDEALEHGERVGLALLHAAKNIDIKFTGLRDGEKLFEEVLNDKEATKPTHHPKIMIANVRSYDYDVAKKNEDELLELSYTHEDMAIVKKMKEIVPEYKSRVSKYEVLDNTK